MPKITDVDILGMDKVLPAVAAEYIGTTPDAVRMALQEGRAPFGWAVENSGGRWTYNISPGMLVAYKRGTMAVKL